MSTIWFAVNQQGVILKYNGNKMQDVLWGLMTYWLARCARNLYMFEPRSRHFVIT